MVIDRVSLMSLHLGLGLGKYMLDEFEIPAIEVDCQIHHFVGALKIEMQNLLEKERELIQEKSQHEAHSTKRPTTFSKRTSTRPRKNY